VYSDAVQGRAIWLRLIRAALGASVLLALPARADIAPEPQKGFRFVNASLTIDRTGVPADRALLFVHADKFHRLPDKSEPEPLQESFPIGAGACVFVFAVSAEQAALRTTAKELAERSPKPAMLCAAPREEIAKTDPRWLVERRVRAVGSETLRFELNEDVFRNEAGVEVCRRPPLGEDELEAGDDPCDPAARLKRIKLFVHMHATAVGIGSAVGAVLIGAGITRAIRRRRRKASNQK